MEHLGLREHGVVLKFSASDGGAVVRDDDEERVTLPQVLEGGLVAYASQVISTASAQENSYPVCTGPT